MEDNKYVAQDRPKIYLEDAPGYFKGVIAAFLFALVTNIFLYGVLKGEGLGINVPLSVLAFYIARGISMPEWSFTRCGNWVLLIFIAFFSMSFVFFNNGFLLFLNVLAIAAVSGIQLALASGCCDKSSDISIFFAAVHNIFAKPFMGIAAFVRGLFKKRETSPKRKLAIGIVIGALVALAVTVPVIALLASADAMFSRLVEKVFALDSFGELVGRIAVFITVLIFTGSIFTSALTKRMPRQSAVKKYPKFNIVAVYIVLVALTLPLLAFGAVQLLYMTKAQLLPVGVTYSAYARTGFFQLCAAAVIVFTVIAVSVAFTRHAEKKAKVGLNVLYTLLALGTLMLLASSFMRMTMYESAFGYTRLRLYVQAFMILLGIVVVFVTLRVWIEKLPLVRIVFVCTLIGLIGLTYFNVDGFIGRHNPSKAETPDRSSYETYEFVDDGKSGLDYLITLSVDAFPGYAHTLKIEDFTPVEIDYTLYNDYSEENQHELDMLNQFNYDAELRRDALERMYKRASRDNTFGFNTTRSKALPILEDLHERGFFTTEEDRAAED